MDIVIIDGLSFALPLFIMAIGGIYCEKSGVTMLAVEGLQGFGAFIGAFVAVAIAGNFVGDSPAPFYIAMVMAHRGPVRAADEHIAQQPDFLHCHGYGGCGRKSVCTDPCHVMSEVQGQSGYQWCGSQYSGHGADRIFNEAVQQSGIWCYVR